MSLLRKTVFFALSILFLFSCSEEENEEKLETDYTYAIEFSTECGWCAGTKLISVKRGEIEYTRIIPCGENKGTVVKTQNFDYEKWEELIANFDTDYFNTLYQLYNKMRPDAFCLLQ